MDISQFFEALEKDKNPDTSSVTIPIPCSVPHATITIQKGLHPVIATVNPDLELIDINDVYAFPLYIGRTNHPIRHEVDKCLKSDNTFLIENYSVLGQSIKTFSDSKKGEEFSIEMQTNPIDVTEKKWYPVRFVYAICNTLTKSATNRENLNVGFRYVDPKNLPTKKVAGRFKTMGYFYLSGQMDFEEHIDGLILKKFEISGINYYSEVSGTTQDIIPHVPF